MDLITNPESLIGTPYNPEGFDVCRNMARVAKAYHALAPYPSYSPMTKDWKTEDRGPFPRCLPFVRNIVKKSATWLFGKPITFDGSDKNIISLVNDAWTANDMGRRAYAMALLGGQTGGMALKWSYDEQNGGAKIQILDASEHTRFYWDPLDVTRLLMARVQFPVYNAKTGNYVWYREDWTENEIQFYKPLETTLFYGGRPGDPNVVANLADLYDQWRQDKREANPFGIIPLWYVRNIETGTTIGEGDLWAVLNAVDLINFTYDLAHKNNQKTIDPVRAYIDLAPAPEDPPGANNPGGERVLESKDDKTGRIETLNADPSLRPHLREFATDIKKMVFEACGSVEIDAAEITNKGNLTQAVLAQIYMPLIESTNAKRQSYGEDGICVFLERMSLGLSNLGAKGWKPLDDIQIHWAPYFTPTPSEKIEEADYQTLLLAEGLTTKERAIRAIASQDGVIDIDDFTAEISVEQTNLDPKALDPKVLDPKVLDPNAVRADETREGKNGNTENDI